MDDLEPSSTRISIHALLAESDTWARGSRVTYVEFLSTLSLRRATLFKNHIFFVHSLFLSTLSLRRATGRAPSPPRREFYFYPRSPCGERPELLAACTAIASISIHALLAESDNVCPHIRRFCAISIHALLAESDELWKLRNPIRPGISIHALLAESDGPRPQPPKARVLFLSTLSLRRATGKQ